MGGGNEKLILQPSSFIQSMVTNLNLSSRLTSFVALPSRSKPSPSLSLRRPRSVCCRLTEPAAAFDVVVVCGESDGAIASSFTELQNGGCGWKVEPEQLPPTGEGGVEEDDDPEEEEEKISSVHVPREKYINVSKSDLVNSIVTTLLDSQDGGDADIFLLLAS